MGVTDPVFVKDIALLYRCAVRNTRSVYGNERKDEKHWGKPYLDEHLSISWQH